MYIMKALIFAVVVSLTGCGTIGGLVSGAGKDLTSLGNTISK
jgi:predicted small secreted protein